MGQSMTEEKKIEQEKNLGSGAKSGKNTRGGFWLRAIALILDLIILNSFFHLLTFVFREQLFEISHLTEYLGAGFVFCYFWLLNGPLGKGRTIGKLLFNLRVQNYEGNALSLAAAFRRAILITPHFIILIMDPLFDSLQDQMPLLHVGILSFSLSFIVSNALLVGLHPLKQGYHDYFARSLVVRGGAPVTYEKFKTIHTSTLLSKKVRPPSSAFQSAGIAFLVIFCLQVWSGYQQVKSETWKSQNELFKEMETRFAIKGFDLAGYRILPIREKKEGKETKIPPKDIKEKDNVTSPPIATDIPPYGIYVIYTTPDDVSGEAIRNDESIRNMLPGIRDWFQEMAPVVFERHMEVGRIPASVEVYFSERFSLFLYTHEKTEANFSYPLDTKPFLEIYEKAKSEQK